MGRNLPGNNHDALEWLEGHIAQWVADPPAIGVTSAVVLDLATTITNTRAAFTSVEAIRSDSKALTSNFHSLADGMRTEAAPIIANIKNYAENHSDPQQVYAAAGITPADPPSPAPAPEQPSDLTATLNGDGSVSVSWECRGPTGTVYLVRRKLAGETSFSQIGVGDGQSKTFSDTNVPSGTASALYTIQGVRGPDSGLVSQAMTVLFGGTDGGAEGLTIAA